MNFSSPRRPWFLSANDAAARSLRTFSLVIALAGAPGCTTVLPSMMVNSPNSIKPLVGTVQAVPAARAVLGIDQHFRVAVGPPDASLSVGIVEPPREMAPRATVLVLHGIGSKSLYMLDTAHELASAGYRAVLVDLRGHGGSTGRWMTYGVRESEDLRQVLQELDHRGLATGPVGVFGISYGATTGILFAAREPRVKAVVAVAPFASLRDEAPLYLKTILPGIGHLTPRSRIDRLVDDAARMAGFHPDDADASQAIHSVAASVLLIHGENDLLVPKGQSEKIHQAAPEKSELVIVPGLGHLLVFFDPTGEVEQRTRNWFDEHLTTPPPIAAEYHDSAS